MAPKLLEPIRFGPHKITPPPAPVVLREGFALGDPAAAAGNVLSQPHS